MPVWLIPLILELLKLLPQVIAWIKEHPKAEKKEVIAQLPNEVKGLLEKLREKRKGTGSPPGLVGE